MPGLVQGCAKNSVRAVRLSFRVLRGILTPSLVSYFFWCSAIYIAFGTIAFVMKASVDSYFCAIPAMAPGKGCGNCSSKLLLCDKAGETGECWRYAMNLSLQQNTNAEAVFFAFLQGAIMDSECNSLVEASTDPVQLMSQIASGSYSITEDCVKWHCNVMLNAYTLSSDLITPSMVCTNNGVNGVPLKPPELAEVCVCDMLQMTTTEAVQFEDICAPYASGLILDVFDHKLSDVDKCYRRAVQFQGTSVDPVMAQNWAAFTNGSNSCTSFQGSVFDWFRTIVDVRIAAEELGDTPPPVPNSCLDVMCYAFNWTIQTPLPVECSWRAAPLNTVTYLDLLAVSSICSGGTKSDPVFRFLSSPGNIARAICNQTLDPVGISICSNTSLYSSASAAGSTMLDGSIRRLEDLGAHRQASVKNIGDVNDQLVSAGLQSQGCSINGGPGRPCGGGSDMYAPARLYVPPPRRVQSDATTAAPSSGASKEDDLEDWSVTDWTKCTCYQQCTVGVKTRSVTCPAGVKCKSTKPAAAQQCSCGHCAKCTWGIEVIWIVAIGYWAQGGIALLLLLAFFSVSGMEEDDMCDVSCGRKMIGMVCRFLPVTVRFLTFPMTFVVILLIFMALVPSGIDMWHDCFTSSAFRLLGILLGCCFVFQIAMGITLKRTKPMPPWLHNASKKGPMQVLCKPIAAIGP